jgi:CHAT domain-containing protein
MLVAIQPLTQGQVPLPYTKKELQTIEEHIPKESLVKFGIPEAPAHVQDILSALPTASFVHLACHGVQDATNPLDSMLLLEGQLKVSQLMKLDMRKASLVFLSACQTAMVDDTLPDEPIHLAATLLFAGFRGAVATMWYVAIVRSVTLVS